MKKRDDELTFKDILDVFVPKIWIIAIVAVVLAVVMGAYSALFVKDTYTTKTIFGVKSSSQAPNESNVQYIDYVIAITAYRFLDDDFFAPVVRDLNANYPGEYDWVSSAYVSRTVSYTPLDRGILQVSITTHDSRLSYAISQSLETLIPTQINEENPGLFDIAVYAKPDRTPAANPKGTVKNAIIGFSIGAIVSAVAVWMCSAFDMVVRNKKKIEDYFDIPVIGVIPVNDTVNETEGVENV